MQIQKDYSRAEEFFERAILASPSDGEVLSQYAKLIYQVHGDVERATHYHEQAVKAAPEDWSAILLSSKVQMQSCKHSQQACADPMWC